MTTRRILAAIMLLMFAGIAAAKDLHREFTLPGVSLEQAYHRANDFMHACHRGGGLSTTTITGEIYPEEQTADVRAMFTGGMIPERIKITHTGQGAQVSVTTVHRVFKWDTKELDAVQRSLETGTPTCR